MTLTAERLRDILEYNPETGEWIWTDCPRAGYNGRIAGSYDAYGYKKIKIDGKMYFCSRLAFLYMTGAWPEDEADHIDGDTHNDRWVNLRNATRRENLINRGMRHDNQSGIVGVFWNSSRRKWCAQIDRKYLGLFDTIEQAKDARDKAVAEMHGDFARTPTLVRLHNDS